MIESYYLGLRNIVSQLESELGNIVEIRSESFIRKAQIAEPISDLIDEWNYVKQQPKRSLDPEKIKLLLQRINWSTKHLPRGESAQPYYDLKDEVGQFLSMLYSIQDSIQERLSMRKDSEIFYQYNILDYIAEKDRQEIEQKQKHDMYMDMGDIVIDKPNRPIINI